MPRASVMMLVRLTSTHPCGVRKLASAVPLGRLAGPLGGDSTERKAFLLYRADLRRRQAAWVTAVSSVARSKVAAHPSAIKFQPFFFLDGGLG